MTHTKSKKLENQSIVTQQPNKEILAAWYDIEPRAFRNRFKAKGLCIKNRVLTEGDYGQIFFTMGIPPRLPAKLRDWALALAADYCHLMPFNAAVF